VGFDRVKEFRAEQAVDDAVVAGERERHALTDDDFVLFDHGLFDGGADGEDGGVGWVDDRAESIDARHTEIGDAEGAAGKFSRLEFLVFGAATEGFGFGADLEERLAVGIADHRGDEPVFNRDGEGNVNRAVGLDTGAGPRRVDAGNSAQGSSGGLEHEIVDGEFDSVFGEAGVELFAEGEEWRGVDFDIEVEMRDGGLGLEEAARDGGAHVGRGGEGLGLHRALVEDRAVAPSRSSVGARGFGGSGWRVFLGGEDIGADDAATRAGAFNAAEVDAFFFGEFTSKRGNFHTTGGGGGHSRSGGLGRGRDHDHRHGRWSGGGDYRRGGSHSGGGFRGRGFDFLAGFADGAEGRTDWELGAGGAENFEERAVEVTFQLHGGLVGLDLGEHVPSLDGVALFFEPFDQRAHRHGVAEFGHCSDISHTIVN
jgi:hypothetical protein